jgi:hypothetical protein
MYHVFGATTATGEAFRQSALKLNGGGSVRAYSRGVSPADTTNHYVDFSDPLSFRPAFEESSLSVWVSFEDVHPDRTAAQEASTVEMMTMIEAKEAKIPSIVSTKDKDYNNRSRRLLPTPIPSDFIPEPSKVEGSDEI